MTMDHDFAVGQCTISPPGQGLITGYQMIAESDGQLDMASIKVPEYTKDDVYNLGQRTEEQQLAGAMNAQMGPIMLAFAGAQPDHKTLISETPQSHIAIAIRNNGAHGEAKFDNFMEPMAAINEKLSALGSAAATQASPSPDPVAADSPSPAPSPEGSPSAADVAASAMPASSKVSSGTITWDCEVKHLNAGPINDMFKKIIPH
ncbi:MAG: hypothetical protein M3169_00325 [Candidatus Eremiobacteraeota bacterium]|nr:hypothetical protein [Candidatus Eremiobacteraeota bacterium]